MLFIRYLEYCVLERVTDHYLVTPTSGEGRSPGNHQSGGGRKGIPVHSCGGDDLHLEVTDFSSIETIECKYAHLPAISLLISDTKRDQTDLFVVLLSSLMEFVVL